jgi:hypothetical protein
MGSFLLNPLSAIAQFKTTDDAHQAIRDVVKCLDYLSPALSSQRRKLIVDPCIEHRDVVEGTSLIQAINSLPKRDRDTKEKWFTYTKQQATKAALELIEVTISSPDPACAQSVSEDATKDFLVDRGSLISFGGCQLTESKTLRVSSDGQSIDAGNAHKVEHLLVPTYTASPKHRKQAYYDKQRGEQVAAMPLPPDIAREVLLAGLPDGRDYLGWHRQSGKFIRFKLTGGNDYHGFEVAEGEVPAELRKQLILKQ